MMRDHLLTGNLAVTRAALLGRMGQERIMRVVTGHARPTGVVQLRNDLGKPGRPRRIVTVADGAIPASPGCAGAVLIGGLDMSCRRTVACLARYALVIGLLLDLIDVVMAVKACLIAGINDLLRDDFIDSPGPVMAIVAKRFRHYQVADDDQNNDCRGKKED